MTERERLTELIMNTPKIPVIINGRAQGRTYQTARNIADHLLANGVIVPPCKVGDTVYYLNTQYHMALYRNKVYEAKVARIVVTSLGVALVIHIRDDSGCCEVPDIRDFGKTVFLTLEEAEKALAERSNDGKS